MTGVELEAVYVKAFCAVAVFLQFIEHILYGCGLSRACVRDTDDISSRKDMRNSPVLNGGRCLVSFRNDVLFQSFLNLKINERMFGYEVGDLFSNDCLIHEFRNIPELAELQGRIYALRDLDEELPKGAIFIPKEANQRLKTR